MIMKAVKLDFVSWIYFLLLQLHTLLMLFSVLWPKCEQQNWAVLASS